MKHTIIVPRRVGPRALKHLRTQRERLSRLNLRDGEGSTSTYTVMLAEDGPGEATHEFFEAGCHLWRMETLTLTVELQGPTTATHEALAHLRQEGASLVVTTLGGYQQETAGVLTCTSCGKAVKQAFLVRNAASGREEVLWGKCLAEVGLGGLTHQVFTWTVEKHAYWHYLDRLEWEAEEVVSTTAVLALGRPLVDAYGYEKVGSDPSTKDLVLKMLHGEDEAAQAYRATVDFTTGEDYRRQLISHLGTRSFSDWTLSVLDLLQQEWTPLRAVGVLASGLCLFEQVRKKQEEVGAWAQGYLGAEGRREVFTATLERRTAREGYGYNSTEYTYVLRSEQGHKVLCYTSVLLPAEQGETFSLKATVAAHYRDRDGVYVTRVKRPVPQD